MQSATGNPTYALRDVPGKGKGLVATEKISKGTRILSEEPIITVPRNELDNKRLRTFICQQVDALSEHERRAFLSMHNIHTYGNAVEQYLGIVRTNALPIETDESEGGIFLEACRINHACDNNAQKNWNENIKRHTVHALRDIYEGEEITIYYLAIHSNRKARHQALQAKFGFICSCGLCSLPPEQSQENDRRLDKIYRLDSVIGRGGIEGILSSPLRTLRFVDQQVRLYNEQGADDVGLPRAFLDAAQIAIANGDLARGRTFAERAVFGWRTAVGGDSTEVIKHGALVQDPSKHELYGISMKWRTTVDEVPRELEPGDFEDWLWKREKPRHPGQLELDSHMDCLQIPQNNDSSADVARKLTALTEAVHRGQSIAAVTNYAASMTQEREPMNIAVTEMTEQEYEAWSVYTAGKYPLPKIDWNSSHDPAPTSTKPLRIACRRAEALNRLYNTERADPGHSVWFTKHEIVHLPLVKAMARIIGAERNLVGGQYALNATQVADLQTINRILSVSTEILKKSGSDPMSAKISSAQRVLGFQRDKLREMLANNGGKEKEHPH